jgi:hypothetical protein
VLHFLVTLIVFFTAFLEFILVVGSACTYSALCIQVGISCDMSPLNTAIHNVLLEYQKHPDGTWTCKIPNKVVRVKFGHLLSTSNTGPDGQKGVSSELDIRT